ncbi:MAG: hypothetical protein EXR72_04255 [Myxococcales bacterium]|nr:hypothetical protein [Myxococcales bacterium]
MRDVHATGAARIEPHPVDADVKPARWAHRPARLARMDRLCGLALVAADAALLDAGIDPSGWDGDRVGIVVGTAFGCHATNEEYYRGLLEGGVRGASPRLFAYTLPSSPAGELTIHYGARGPSETVVSGRHAGVEAASRAARLCAAGLCDVAIAIAVDVGGATLAALGHEVRDAAAAVVIERGDPARGRSAPLRGQIVGAATAWRGSEESGPRPDEAASAATVGALAEGGEAQAMAVLPVRAGDDAVGAMAALADWIRAPTQASLLVQTDPGGGAAVLFLIPPGYGAAT